MSKLRKYELRALVSQEEYNRMEQEASGRNTTLAKTIRDCLNEYLNLRVELATAMTEPGKAGEEQSGKIIHTLLARTEERLAATIGQLEERMNQMNDQMMVLTAMLDRHYFGMMTHLPTVPKELQEAAKASAKKRHEKWLNNIEKLLANKK